VHVPIIAFLPKKSLSGMRSKQNSNLWTFWSTADIKRGNGCVGLAFREDLFDDAYPDGAAHVPDGKPSKLRNVRESL